MEEKEEEKIDIGVLILADFWHQGYHYQMITWRNDAYSRLRLFVKDDNPSPKWSLIWIQP